MEAAKDKARAAHKSHSFSSSDKHLNEWTQQVSKASGPTDFVGYEQLTLESEIITVSDGESEQEIIEKQGWVITKGSPFYAESGGQVGDTGILKVANGEFIVEDTTKLGNAFAHKGKVVGRIGINDRVDAQVDASRRDNTKKNHTATHLLHEALRVVLGDHVTQKGSLNDPERLRFDFSHFEADQMSTLTAWMDNADLGILETTFTPQNYDPHKSFGHTHWRAAGQIAAQAKKWLGVHHHHLADDHTLDLVDQELRAAFPNGRLGKDGQTIWL